MRSSGGMMLLGARPPLARGGYHLHSHINHFERQAASYHLNLGINIWGIWFSKPTIQNHQRSSFSFSTTLDYFPPVFRDFDFVGVIIYCAKCIRVFGQSWPCHYGCIYIDTCIYWFNFFSHAYEPTSAFNLVTRRTFSLLNKRVKH